VRRKAENGEIQSLVVRSVANLLHSELGKFPSAQCLNESSDLSKVTIALSDCSVYRVIAVGIACCQSSLRVHAANGASCVNGWTENDLLGIQ